MNKLSAIGAAVALAGRRMNDIGRPLEWWYVVFVAADRTIVHRFLKPGFQHCYAVAWDEAADRWVIIEPGFDGVYVRAVRDDVMAALWAELHRRRAHVLLARAERHQMFRPRFMLTCVSAIAALLALRRCCAVSPWQLYRSLRKRGAVEVLARV